MKLLLFCLGIYILNVTVVPFCLVLVGAVFLSAPACDQLLWAWASSLCLCGVGWWVGLVWLFFYFPLFVGVVWSLWRPSAVCFLGVVVLASAAAAALHQCAVYLGAVHCTKSTHGLGCSWCLLLSNHSENHLENWSRIGISIRSDVHSKVVWVV